MSEKNIKEIDSMSIRSLFKSMNEIRKKLGDRTITEEERNAFYEESRSMGKKLRELMEQNKAKRITPEKAKQILESVDFPESEKIKWEILISMWESVKDNKDLPQSIKDKLKEIKKKESNL